MIGVKFLSLEVESPYSQSEIVRLKISILITLWYSLESEIQQQQKWQYLQAVNLIKYGVLNQRAKMCNNAHKRANTYAKLPFIAYFPIVRGW